MMHDMNRIASRLILLALVLLFIPGISNPGTAKVYLLDFDEERAEFLMLQAINTIRYNEDLPLVSLDENLRRSSKRHAQDMALRDYFDHFSPDGLSPDDRARVHGIANPVSENIGIIRTFGQDLEDVVDALMRGFMDSPQHRRNILDPYVTHIGIGFMQDVDGTNRRLESDGDTEAVYRGFGTVLVVQDFCIRRVALLEPSPYLGWTLPGEFVTLRLDFTDEVDEAFLRITPDNDPAEQFDIPMSKCIDDYRARFAIDREGAFTIGIYANSPSADWFYREQGSVKLTVKSH
jgi:hypothetical protein